MYSLHGVTYYKTVVLRMYRCIGHFIYIYIFFWQRPSLCVLTNLHFIPSVHNNISVQWHNIYNQLCILVINQLDAQNFCFTISLFHASTCFEHHVLIVSRLKLYYTASGIIISIRGRPVHRTATCSDQQYMRDKLKGRLNSQ